MSMSKASFQRLSSIELDRSLIVVPEIPYHDLRASNVTDRPEQPETDGTFKAISAAEPARIGWAYALLDYLRNQSHIAMITCLMFGLGFATSHHFYYQHVDGSVAASTGGQEWALRFGNALALATKTFLITAVGVAYTQQIWATVKKRPISIQGLDAIFAGHNDIRAFLYREMWTKNLYGTLIALILWFLPLALTILPSSSLAVHSVSEPNGTQKMNVPMPAFINDAFAVTNGEAYTGSKLSRLVYSSLTGLSSVPLVPHYSSSYYSVNFTGPSLNCKQDKWAGANENNSLYLDIGLNRIPGISNVLYVYTQVNQKFVQCSLYNTSFQTQFSYQDGVQSTISNTSFLNPIKYPTGDARNLPVSFPYQAWFDPLATVLQGQITPVGAQGLAMMTALPYSSDLAPALGANVPSVSSLNTANLNLPIEDLLEQMSVNLTMSLFAVNTLSPASYQTDVAVLSPTNYYAYRWQSLFLPYLASITCTVLAIVIGMRAIATRSLVQGTSFSTLLRTTRNHDLDELVGADTSGMKPLSGEIARARLQFVEVEKGGWAFRFR